MPRGVRRWHGGMLALAMAKSGNKKIGEAATTYAAQTSCPSECVFFDGGGCYAETGAIGKFVTAPLNRAAAAFAHDELDVALAEAQAIDNMQIVMGRPLRLHTVGDCRTNAAAMVVAGAARRYIERGGGPVWTYTHAWRRVARASWGCVSVLASCETPLDVVDARSRGYATALVVEEFVSPKLYEHGCVEEPARAEEGNQAVRLRPGAAVLPCPAQTYADVSCSSCRLCFNDQGIRARGYSIGFELHGTPLAIRQAEKALRDPDDPQRRLTSRDHALAFRAEHGHWPRPSELARAADVGPSSAKQMLARLKAEEERAA